MRKHFSIRVDTFLYDSRFNTKYNTIQDGQNPSLAKLLLPGKPIRFDNVGD